MGFLVRKFTQNKWPSKEEQTEGWDIDDIYADAFTSCLRTSGNTLSTWFVSDLTKLSEVVLALSTSLDKISRIQLIYFHKSEVLKSLSLNETLGATPVEDLKKNHLDIADLNIGKLKNVSQIYLDSIKNEKVEIFTKNEVKDIIKTAISNKRLEVKHIPLIRNKDINKLLEEL